MSRVQRTTIVFLAVVVAVAAFLVLRPGEDEEGDSPPPTQATQTDAAPSTSPGTTTTPKAEPKRPQLETVRVRGGRVRNLKTFEAKPGETVTFQVIADDKHEIHLHGYDLTEKVTKDRPARFRLKADQQGIFEIEIEDTHTQIAELKVEP